MEWTNTDRQMHQYKKACRDPHTHATGMKVSNGISAKKCKQWCQIILKTIPKIILTVTCSCCMGFTLDVNNLVQV